MPDDPHPRSSPNPPHDATPPPPAPPLSLESLGWNDAWAAHWTALQRPKTVPARVSIEDKQAYRVVCESGELSAVVSGALRHRAGRDASQFPKVGDWVVLQPAPAGSPSWIHGVFPRRSWIKRKAAGRESLEQLLVVNVDAAFIVQALDATFNLRRLERFIVMAREGGVQPIVLLNKADLVDADDSRVADARSAFADVPQVLSSARSGRGLGEIRRLMPPGSSSVFLGVSGAGKSSLINRLYGERIQPTLPVREEDAKGRHTTTWRELLPLPNGALVIDTPGLREFHLGLAEDAVEATFSDIAALAAQCHFRDCTHTREHRCAILAAVEAGTLDRHRFQSFQKLAAETRSLGAQQTDALRRKQNRSGRRREDSAPSGAIGDGLE